MAEILLKDFQIKAIKELNESFNKEPNEVVLKSCTGSGKTIILANFVDEFFKSNSKFVFIWLTPGSGDLEEQSKDKFDKFIHNCSTKLLSDVMTSGFEENDVCFINWELVTKEGNNALREGERKNLNEHIDYAHSSGLNFIIIVDEEHLNKTYKANDIINLFKPQKIIRASATPHSFGKATLVEIIEEAVIAEGLIKKMLVINENVEDGINIDSQIEYLIGKALNKQKTLKSEFERRKIQVNPLIIVQIPNNSDSLLEHIELYFISQGLSYENKRLAVRLADKKENLEDIEENDARPEAIIIKQAVATGWDCPRAHILVKLRDKMDESFEIQTIGRIRRMPQAEHYENDALDMCYLYTFDEKFTEGVKLHLGKGASEAKLLYLKDEYRKFKLTKEYKSSSPIGVDPKVARLAFYRYFKKKYNITNDLSKNKKILEAHGYNFSKDIIVHSVKGDVRLLNKDNIDHLNELNATVKLNTHQHGREFHKAVGLVGSEVGLPYEKMVVIIRNLFDMNSKYSNHVLNLETKEMYAFVLNNQKKLITDFSEANSDVGLQQEIDISYVGTMDFLIPKELIFTYNAKVPGRVFDKNVYDGYMSTGEPRSDTERLFEKYCQENQKIEWFYKNGDSGLEYFSIVFTDNAGKQRLFYPDYIISQGGQTWIIEAKGGESKSGANENIDKYAAKKANALKQYANQHSLNAGIVRLNRFDMELYVNKDSYTEDMSDDNWKHIDAIFI